MEKKDKCCTPKGQVPRYVDCIGCDKKPIETMSKQTAIEWYANASHELIVKKNNGEITNTDFLIMHHNLFYEAQKMEKEEIMKVVMDFGWSKEKADKYYNETYGGQDESK